MNLKTRATRAIIIGVLFVGVAILIWAYQTGRVKIFGEAERIKVEKAIQTAADWTSGVFEGLYFSDQGLKNTPISTTEMEKYENAYAGFSIQKPKTWTVPVKYANGVVSVLETADGTSGVFVYPVVLKNATLTDQQVADKYFDVLKTQVGTGLTLSNGATADGLFGADITGTIGTVSIKGKLNSLKNTTGRNSDLVTFWWTNANDYASKAETMKFVVQSYKTLDPNQYQTLSYQESTSKNYNYCIPSSGWKQTEDSSPLVFAVSTDNKKAGVTFAYSPNGANFLTDQQFEAGDPEGFINGVINKIFKEVTPGDKEDLGTIPNAPYDTTWKFFSKEFEGKANDTTYISSEMLKCVATAATGQITQTITANGVTYTSPTSGMIYIRCAEKTEWDNYDNITKLIQESITIESTAQASELTSSGVILPRNNPSDSSTIMGSYAYRQQVQLNLSTSWHEAIMGFEYASKPGTVEIYQMPLNSWSNTGSEYGGNQPGYYIQSGNGWTHLNLVGMQ